MHGIDLEKVEEAWRRAGDADIIAALSCPDELEPDVLQLVRREAARRGLEEAPNTPALPRAPGIGTRLWQAVLGFLSEHRYVAAGGAAALVALVGAIFSPMVMVWLGSAWPAWSAALMLAYVAAIAAAARPLQSYRRVLLTALAGMICFQAVTWINLLWRTPEWFLDWLGPFLLGNLVNATVLWAVPSLILCGAVAYCRRRWPEYGPGVCTQCGYDLRGLPQPRCPECGTPFSVEQATPPPEQDPPADL